MSASYAVLEDGQMFNVFSILNIGKYNDAA